MAKKTAKPVKTENDEVPDFEESVEELEGIVRRLEQGGGPLEEALADYSNAIQLIKSCHTRLEQAERKVEILSGVDAQGNPVTQPISEMENTLLQKQGSRGERRSAAVSKPRSAADASDDLGGLF